MLDKFRSLSQTWVAKVLLALITIPFALFGIEYYFRQSGGGADTVAKVDGYAISQAEFNDNLRSQLERMSASMQGANPSSLDNSQTRYAVLEALINRHLITAYADKTGLRVADRFLVDEIGKINAFQEDGKFSQKRYEEVLRANNLTPALFEMRLRDDLKTELVQESLTTTDWTPAVAVDAFVTLVEQSREVAVAEITPDAFLDKVKVDDAAVKAYYDAHQDQFMVSERVKVEYLVLSADQLVGDTAVTPEEIAKVYNDPANKARWGGQETRRASHILISVPASASTADRAAAKAKAEKIAAEAKANPSRFAALARQYSQDPGSAAQGGDLGYFGRGAMTKPFDEAVFGMKAHDVTGPVETEFGYHIIQLTDIREGKGKTLAEATPAITAELKKQHAQQRFAEMADNFSNLVYEQSGSLKPAADKFKLPLHETGWLTRSGGAEYPLLDNPKLLAALFAQESVKDGRNTQAIEVAPNVLVSGHVTAHEPAVARPLAEVSEAIQKQLRHEQAAKLAKQEGEARLADLKAGKAVALKWSDPKMVNRQEALGIMPPDLVAPAFKLEVDKLPAYAGVDSGSGAYAIARVSRVAPGNPADAARRKQAEVGLARGYGDEVMGEFLTALRANANVRLVNKAVMEKSAQN
jgi:peptidyl-prolyl cis-trans isomerase D